MNSLRKLPANTPSSTKDAFRPGEFTATIRTEQYRDLLRAEKAIMEKHRDLAKDEAAAQVSAVI